MSDLVGNPEDWFSHSEAHIAFNALFLDVQVIRLVKLAFLYFRFPLVILSSPILMCGRPAIPGAGPHPLLRESLW